MGKRHRLAPPQSGPAGTLTDTAPLHARCPRQSSDLTAGSMLRLGVIAWRSQLELTDPGEQDGELLLEIGHRGEGACLIALPGQKL